jgi:phage shock protein PspC (stress-responsive transcriptional regulator)
MTNVETESAALPPPTPAPQPREHRWARSDDRVVLGVAGGLGRALAIEPLLVRIAFVVLALFSGVGIVLYVGAFVLLADSPTSHTPSPIRRIVGAVAVLLSVRWLFSGEGWLFSGQARLPSPGWIVALGLLGAAVALWHGRSTVDTSAAPVPAESLAATDGGSTIDRWASLTARRRDRPRRPRRPRSPLGLLTIGAATVIGALVWLLAGSSHNRGALAFGMATVVIGLGLLVSAFAGRARWLILPALLTSAAAVGAAALSFAGVSLDNPTGSGTDYVQPGRTVDAEYHRGIGNFELILADDATDAATSIDVAIGDLTVDVPEGSRVQVDARVGVGTIEALGSTRSGYRRSLTIDDQKDGAHMITLKLRVGVGNIVVHRSLGNGGPFVPPAPVVPQTLPATPSSLLPITPIPPITPITPLGAATTTVTTTVTTTTEAQP